MLIKVNVIPLVNIVMVTYNQEKYVAQAIESVLSQKTTFPFVLIIGDDCSSDETYNICRLYADKHSDKVLLLKNETNVGLVKNYQRVFNACTAKYIAILEGDDYWIVDDKLQKQTEILEADFEAGLVHASKYTLFEDYNKIIPPSKKIINENLSSQGYVYKKLIKANFICPLTVLFRRSLLIEFIDYQFFIHNDIQTIDYALWLGFSLHSKIVFMNCVVGTYRVRATSISNNPSIKSKEKFLQTARLVVDYYIKKQPVDFVPNQNNENWINKSLPKLV